MAITPHAAGTWAATDGAATATVTLPTHSTGDLLIVCGGQKAATIANSNPTITTPATGWTRFLDGASGTANSGNGTGSVHMSVFWKIAASAAETNPVITWGDNSSPAVVNAWSFTSGTGFFADPVGVIKAGNVATSISITHNSNPGITVGDLGLVILTMGDNNALTVPSWSATGTTLDAVVEYPATAISSSTGNDMAADAGYRIVNSGTASAAPVQTHTSAAADENIGAFVRIREAVATNASAELTSATGAAQTPSTAITSAAGLASGTAAAQTAQAQVGPLTAAGSVTATATAPTADITSEVELASATAAAQTALAGLGAQAEVAQVAAAALDATVETALGTNAEAGNAAATGAANAPTVALATTAGNAVATAAAGAPSVSVGGDPTVDAATVAANAPTVALTAPTSTVAALAAAYDPSGAVAVAIGLSAVTVTALNPTVQTTIPGDIEAVAGLGSVAATAYNATVLTSGGGTSGRYTRQFARPAPPNDDDEVVDFPFEVF